MLCLVLGDAKIPFKNIIRQPINAIQQNDIRAMNCKPGTREYPNRKASYLFGPHFQNFDVDVNKVSVPKFVDF